MIKHASATPSKSTSVASVDKELRPIPSPPWAKSRPLPQETQPVESSQSSTFTSNHYYPNAATNRHYKFQSSSNRLYNLSSSALTLASENASTSSAHDTSSYGPRYPPFVPAPASTSASASRPASPSFPPSRVTSQSPEYSMEPRHLNSEGESEIDREEEVEQRSRRGKYHRMAKGTGKIHSL